MSKSTSLLRSDSTAMSYNLRSSEPNYKRRLYAPASNKRRSSCVIEDQTDKRQKMDPASNKCRSSCVIEDRKDKDQKDKRQKMDPASNKRGSSCVIEDQKDKRQKMDPACNKRRSSCVIEDQKDKRQKMDNRGSGKRLTQSERVTTNGPSRSLKEAMTAKPENKRLRESSEQNVEEKETKKKKGSKPQVSLTEEPEPMTSNKGTKISATSLSKGAAKIGATSVAEKGLSSNSQNNSRFVCEICIEPKCVNESFSIKGCSHTYCSDCIHKYVASRLQENVAYILCPASDCKGKLEPDYCQSILPHEVFERWCDALCEAAVLGFEKFYCPYKDCSGMLVDEGGQQIKESECPHCRRLFCAQCKVPWHSDIDCNEFQKLHKDERQWEDIMLMKLAQNKLWKRCPRCSIYVERTQGCKYMKCRCGASFCYGCGTTAIDIGTHFCHTCRA